MVAPAIAAAAAPVIVQSATSDDGLLNKLFKIAMLVGFLLLAVFGFIILNIAVDIFELVGGVGDIIVTVGGTIFGILIPGGNVLFGGVVSGITALFTAFGFGGRR